jgi:predicted DNA-binding protein (UPF0251 family)
MPRRRRLRKVLSPPGFMGFKPYGIMQKKRDCVELLYEEYEAIKLADYNLMNHQEASQLMGISRPTFARIYETARRKIALALVETKEIKTVFGYVWLDGNWFICNNCNARFTIQDLLNEQNCPLCKSVKTNALKN